MAQQSDARFEIRSLLRHDLDQDAALLTTLLIEIRSIIKERVGLSTRIPLSIKEKGENEKNRINQLFQYNGPDTETLRVLNRFHNLWGEDPAQFWQTPALAGLGRLPTAQARIFRCAWDTTCTEAISRVENLAKNAEEIERDVDDMIRRGGHYLNLEMKLGAGASLVLGIDIGESMWTKALPKSGKVHDAVITHIKETNLPDLVAKFGMLRMRVVEIELEALSESYEAVCGGSLMPPLLSNMVPPYPILSEGQGAHDNVDPMYNMVTDVIDWEPAAEGGYIQPWSF